MMRTVRSRLWVALVVVLSPRPALAVGEGVNGFPNYTERVFHQLANRARVDPALELMDCGPACSDAACYGPTAPLLWSDALGRAARFHADEQSKQGFFAHASICTVADDIAATYPDACDGSAACACVGGVSQCMPACSTAQERVGKFGVQYGGEIIITSTTPQSAFYAWLFEDGMGDASCGFSLPKAHRFLLLSGGDAVGFGASNGFTVGDFGSPGAAHKIPSGTHWPREGPSVEVWANWYDFAGGPMQARVNVDGACTDMQVARGTPDNAAYTVMLDGLAAGCHRYYFQFVDAAGLAVTYPTSGSLGIGAEAVCADFSDERPADCDCVPNCDGAQCGDDGCGGSCGECMGAEICVEGVCEVMGCDPACGPDWCGGDGCGGLCDCPVGEVCIGMNCVGGEESGDESGEESGAQPTGGASASGESGADEAGVTAGSDVDTTPTSEATTPGVTQATGADGGGDDGCGCRTRSDSAGLVGCVWLAFGRRRRLSRSRRG
jgi:hypothetical protein